jgi:hypothetical protein
MGEHCLASSGELPCTGPIHVKLFFPNLCIPNTSDVAPSSFSYAIRTFLGISWDVTCEQTYINSNIAQLRPAHRMVQIVFAKVVFRQIRNVRKLHMRDVRRSKHANVHFVRLVSFLALSVSRCPGVREFWWYT